MKKWIKPIFEEFEVNGEVTAYAGAERGDALAGLEGPTGRSVARQGSIASGEPVENLTGDLFRCSIS